MRIKLINYEISFFYSLTFNNDFSKFINDKKEFNFIHENEH